PKPVADTSRPVMSMEQNIETPPPRIEQMAEVPQVREEPAEQRVVSAEVPKTEPVTETKTSEPVAVAASPEPVESQPVHQEPAVIASAPAMSSEVPISQEKTVDAIATPGPEVKADNRWLAESLWRRVAELKRYPNTARMNGQEGRVILKATIRADGQLADVFVQKSSGYSALDEAAIEAVKLACPLHMKHAIGKPQIVVSLPIVYSLAN
ncbi:MAG: energy transducer TonB, partial [Nitrospira sp.]|nr:energy transducer TonB [Nitrospira sp.]MDH5194917.1 energy transducer TonB [Nitrospira sp.]